MKNPYIGFLIGCAALGIYHAIQKQSLAPLAVAAFLAFLLKPFLPPSA